MLKALLTNRLVVGATVCLVFFIAGGMFYLLHVEREIARDEARAQKRLKQWEARKQPPEFDSAELQDGDTSQGGHFHATPIAQPAETTAAENMPQTQGPPPVIGPGRNANIPLAVAESEGRDGSEQQEAQYQERSRQYVRETAAWWDKWQKARAEKLQVFKEGERFSPSITEIGIEAYLEYLRQFRSLPEAERNKIKAEEEAHLEKMKASIEKANAVWNEHPVLPPLPQNK